MNTCGECSKFAECFSGSNTLLGVKPESVTGGMVDESMKIPACPKYEAAK